MTIISKLFRARPTPVWRPTVRHYLADKYLDFNAITERINDIAPEAQQLLHTLNERATELKVTIDRVNDLLE